MRTLTVADIMNPEPVIVKPNENLLECAKKLVRKKTDNLIIAEKGEFKGFLSQKDILWAVIKKSNLSKTKAKDISPKKVITLKPSETIEDAIKKINKFKFYRLPVVQNGKVEGIVNLKDILRLHPDICSHLKEINHIKNEFEQLRNTKRKVEVKDGVCEECGKRGELYKENGVFVCISCLSSL